MSVVEHRERAECLEAEPNDLGCAFLPGNRTGQCSCRRHWGQGVGCAPPEDSLWAVPSITTGLITHSPCKFYYSSQKGFNIFLLFLFGLTNTGYFVFLPHHRNLLLFTWSNSWCSFQMHWCASHSAVWPLAPAAIICPQMFVSYTDCLCPLSVGWVNNIVC